MDGIYRGIQKDGGNSAWKVQASGNLMPHKNLVGMSLDNFLDRQFVLGISDRELGDDAHQADVVIF